MLLLRTALLLFTFLLLTACQKNGTENAGGKAAAAKSSGDRRAFDVRTSTVQTRRVTYELEAVGALMEENRFEIPARVAGVVDDVAFAEGDSVTTGQQLCRIDYDRFALEVQQSESTLLEKQAAVQRALATVSDIERETSTALETARVTLELAQAEFRRRADRGADAFTSSEERDQFEAKYRQAQTAYRDAVNAATTQVALAVAESREAQAALETARAELALVQDNLERSTVRAPIAGVIQQRAIVAGEFVSQGDMIALMVQADPLRLRFTVPESRASRLSKNMRVNFTVPAYRDRIFTGQVYDIGAFADPETREVICWARVSNTDARLKPGFFAHVDIEVDSHDEAMVVPLASVLPTELGMTAYVIEDGIAVRRAVETGLHVTGDEVEILSGLQPGEELVVEGINALQDGVPVNILKPMPGEVQISDRAVSAPASSQTFKIPANNVVAYPAPAPSGTGG